MPFSAGHATMSADNRYVTADNPVGTWYRGCSWQVMFYDRVTGRIAFPFYRNDPLCANDGRWHNHPDPHPQFACRDRYIVSTVNRADGHMDLAVTPTEPLRRLTAPAAADGRDAFFCAFPAEASPMTVGGRIVRQLISATTAASCATGSATRAGLDVWANAREYATLTCNAYLEARLAGHGEPSVSAMCADRQRAMRESLDRAEALLRSRREDGTWGELSDSAMITAAFIAGVRKGRLDADVYGPAARKAWLALCGRFDGSTHALAPMLWCVNAMLEP